MKELLTKGNREATIETLTKLGWEGQLIATLNIKVSVDGKRAEDGLFNIRGELSKDAAKVQASKLWEKADENVILEVELPPGDFFCFEGGRLYSDSVSTWTKKK